MLGWYGLRGLAARRFGASSIVCVGPCRVEPLLFEYIWLCVICVSFGAAHDGRSNSFRICARQLLSALRLFAARIALRFIALALKVEIAFDALPHVELRAQETRR